jgi:hypothetical protein
VDETSDLSSRRPNKSRDDRIAHNEDWCRDLNQRKEALMKGTDLVAGFRCECWQLHCGDRIQLSQADWRETRSRQNRFAVAPEHVAPQDETVIARKPHFWLIEKQGELGDEAEALE